jgi:hypothetical protein
VGNNSDKNYGFSKSWIMVVLYVDDLTVISRNDDLIKELHYELSNRFKMRDLGDVNYLLKMEIKRDITNKITTISQKKYVEDLLRKYNMENCKGVETPQVV